ncbi:MAG: hypothetical protein ACE5JL_17555, partial [Dehalococcoidia bacterium]
TESSFGPFDELHGKLLAQAQQGHPAALYGDWRDFFDSITVLRSDELDGRTVHILQLKNGELPVVTIYVDAETGDVLQSRGVALLRTGGGVLVVNRFEDYREVLGVRIPFRTISSNEQAGRTVIQYEAIEANLDIDDSTFTLSPSPEGAAAGSAASGVAPWRVAIVREAKNGGRYDG